MFWAEGRCHLQGIEVGIVSIPDRLGCCHMFGVLEIHFVHYCFAAAVVSVEVRLRASFGVRVCMGVLARRMGMVAGSGRGEEFGDPSSAGMDKYVERFLATVRGGHGAQDVVMKEATVGYTMPRITAMASDRVGGSKSKPGSFSFPGIEAVGLLLEIILRLFLGFINGGRRLL